MLKNFFVYLTLATIIVSCSKDMKNYSSNNSNDTNQAGNLTKNDKELLRKTIYFDTNSAKISAENLKQDIANIKSSLSQDAKFAIMVEGHCDERGSDSYNYKLGKKRAHSVKKLLVKNGIKPNKIAIISYGEKSPAVKGNDESAWQKNRRSEIIILK
jgi:peptidoglycan-associated lipoprotein